MAREDREHVCFAFIFVCVVSKKLKTLKLSPMAEDAITWGGIGGLGSLVYICGCSISLLLILLIMLFTYILFFSVVRRDA